MSEIPLHLLRRRYSFQWEVISMIVEGKSVLDSEFGLFGFQIQSADDAKRFITNYGYELDDPIERAELLGNFHEALNFIRKNFLKPDNPDGLKLDVPRKILELTEITDLFLMAALHYPNQTGDSSGLVLRDWACSILKVMHTISHLDKDVRGSHYSDIQKQIFDRYYKFVHRDENEKLFLGDSHDDPLRVDLVAFETKSKKSRDSILIKLLVKNQGVEESIYDVAGLRFVTHNRVDCLRILKYLKDKMIVMPPNIKPDRCRNSLLNLDEIKSNQKRRFSELEGLSDNDLVDESSLIEELEKSGFAPNDKGDNPHTSPEYRSIQFTTRQLVKIRNMLYDPIKELKGHMKTMPVDPELQKQAESTDAGIAKMKKVMDRIDLGHLQKEIRFFYPYEVQIVDKASAQKNEMGESSHAEYKKSQIKTAMKRVMGNLVNANK